MLALVALVACTFFPDDYTASGELSLSDLPRFGDCDPNVYIPAGLFDDGTVLAADPHAEVLGGHAQPARIHLGVPSRDLSRSVAFLWQTDPNTLATLVRIAPADRWPDDAVEYAGSSFRFGGAELGEGEVRQHEIRLCGLLQPSTRYTYQVGGAGVWSDPITFSTPGAPRTFDSFRVAISGDSRGGYETWAEVIAAADAREPDLFLFTGDMVELGTDQEEWDAWFDAAEPVISRKPIITTHGNHEFLAQQYFAQFAYPGNEEWFAVDYGNMVVLNMNDTVRDSEHLSTVQVDFADAELANTTATWKVAMHHKPEFSRTRGHGSDMDVREAWTPVWDAHHLNLVFTGHNHTYERSVPIRNGIEAPAKSGTTYVVTGGSGAPLYTNLNPEWFGAVTRAIEHYVIADFGPDGVSIVAYDLDGNEIDSFEL